MSFRDENKETSYEKWNQNFTSFLWGFTDEETSRILGEEGATPSGLTLLGSTELSPEVASLFVEAQKQGDSLDVSGGLDASDVTATQVGEEDVADEDLADETENWNSQLSAFDTPTQPGNLSMKGNEYDFDSEEEKSELGEIRANVRHAGNSAEQILTPEKRQRNYSLSVCEDQRTEKVNSRESLPIEETAVKLELYPAEGPKQLKFSELFHMAPATPRKRGRKRQFRHNVSKKDPQHTQKAGRGQNLSAEAVTNLNVLSSIMEDDIQHNKSFLNWSLMWSTKTTIRQDTMEVQQFPSDLVCSESILPVDIRSWEDEICWDSSGLSLNEEEEEVEWELADETESSLGEKKFLQTVETESIQTEHSKNGLRKEDFSKELISKPLITNPLLESSSWLQDYKTEEFLENKQQKCLFSYLLVNLNDTEMIYEQWDAGLKDPLPELFPLSFWQDDWKRFNISRDEFYDAPNKLIRHFVSHGVGKLEHAFFWKEGQFLPRLPSEELIQRFHRPVSELKDDVLNKTCSLYYPHVLREDNSDISVRSFEIFRNCEQSQRTMLVEYAMEYTPVVVPLPGMASRLVKYSRLRSGDKKNNEEDHFSTSFFHHVYLAPDEPPPLCSGDVRPGQSVLIYESSLFIAPAQLLTAKNSDFLVTVKRDRQDSSRFYVRKIDDIIALGQTEPRINVMAPNTDRFRKFVRDRVLLYVVLECLRMCKQGLPLEIPRSQIDEEFFRSSFPRSAVERTIKELAYLEKGVFKFREPKEGFEALRDMLLKIVTPEILATYESMEHGWYIIQQVGIHMFTHPTAHGDLINAGEKSGVSDGKEVADFIRRNLYRTPWYRAEEMMKLQKKQLREINRCLSRASIGNDLLNENNLDLRISSMTYPQLRSALIFHFHVPGRKIPTNIDNAREMVRRLARKRVSHGFKEKHKVLALFFFVIIHTTLTKMSQSVVEYHRAIIDGFKRFESTRRRAGLISLDDQLLALRDGKLDKINAFMERFRRSNRTVRKGAKDMDEKKTEGELSGDEEKKALEDLSRERFLGPKRMKNLPEKAILVRKTKDPETGEIRKVREVVTDPERIQELMARKKRRSRNKNTNGLNVDKKSLKLSLNLNKLSRKVKPAKSKTEKRQRNNETSRVAKPGGSLQQRISLKYTGQNVVKHVSSRSFRESSKRPPRKTPVHHLNDLLLQIEQCMEHARGYNESVFDKSDRIRLFLVTEATPENRKQISLNLAKPEGEGIDLDLINPLDPKKYKTYLNVIGRGNEMNLSFIREKCKQRKYRDPSQFISDIDLMLKNAEAFHTGTPSYWIIQHVELLKKVAEQELYKHSNEFAVINERILNGRRGKFKFFYLLFVLITFVNLLAEKRRKLRKAEQAHRKAAEDTKVLQNTMQATSSSVGVTDHLESTQLDKVHVENDNESVHMSSNHICDGNENQQVAWEDRERKFS
eukprot:jgi/Galph1/2639/GphlegSOOS_G1303.1